MTTTATPPAALSPIARITQLRGETKPLIAKMKTIFDKAKDEDRDMTASEVAAFNSARDAKNALEAQVDSILNVAGAAIRNGTMHITENGDMDPKRGFQSIGDFANRVAAANLAIRRGQPFDPRMLPSAAAPGTAGNEGSGADGGFLVPPGFGTDIFTLSLDEDSLLPLTSDMQISGNSMMLPKDETTPWGTTGVRAYWQGENSAGTPTKLAVGGMDLRLKKLIGITPVTNELTADALALSQYLPLKLASSIRWKTNEAILFGAGNGTPLGALASPSVVTVAKDSGQGSNTLSATNLATMIARLPPGSFPRSVWLINNDVLPALFTLTLGNYPIYMPAGSVVGAFRDAPYGTLLGRPVMVSQHAKTFSAQGDVNLLDLSYYQTITKAAGVTVATSMHLYFDADAMAFRVTFRIDGQPKLTAAISPANGANKMSPFVQLGAR